MIKQEQPQKPDFLTEGATFLVKLPRKVHEYMIETLNSQEGLCNAREKYHMGDFVYDKVSKKSYLELEIGSEQPSRLEMTTIENLTS